MIKDVSCIESLRREDFVFIDDSIQVKNTHPDNTIQISKWEGNPKDRELMKTLTVLETLKEIDSESIA